MATVKINNPPAEKFRLQNKRSDEFSANEFFVFLFDSLLLSLTFRFGVIRSLNGQLRFVLRRAD